jgi:3-phosphoshikimate 1-carboxyvinyltransferase
MRPSGPVRGRIRPPGSKSITNRALVCAALGDGPSTLAGALDSDDTRVMIESLQRLGFEVATDLAARTIEVVGQSGRIPATSADLFVGNSGTTVRFLAAMLALGHGHYRLDGTTRMRERPIGDLIAALGELGTTLQSEHGNGCPPIIVEAAGFAGGTARIRGDVSSQFLSGLLMAAPYAEHPVELVVEGELVSKPYVAMTLAVMRSFGVDCDVADGRRFVIGPGRYAASRYPVEPDASAASYFFAAAAITRGEVTVEGLSLGSLQGDVHFVDVLARMGCDVRWHPDSITVVGRPLKGVTVDMNAISDTVQTLAAVALFANGPTTITGVAHIRHKETDRIGALAVELRKLGAKVDEQADGLTIHPPHRLHGAEIATYDDHRMAMSLALVGLRVPGVVILDPGCTAKTYPDYFQDLASIATSSR